MRYRWKALLNRCYGRLYVSFTHTSKEHTLALNCFYGGFPHFKSAFPGYLICLNGTALTEMRKNKSRVNFAESSFRQKVRSTFPVAQYHIASPFQNGAIFQGWSTSIGYACLLITSDRFQMVYLNLFKEGKND